MSSRNTVIRSLHDLGAAAWFGGSLMGAVGLNGAAAAVSDPQDRGRVASAGWRNGVRSTPLRSALTSSAAPGSCRRTVVGRSKSGVRANTVTKLAVTGAALGATA